MQSMSEQFKKRHMKKWTSPVATLVAMEHIAGLAIARLAILSKTAKD